MVVRALFVGDAMFEMNKEMSNLRQQALTSLEKRVADSGGRYTKDELNSVASLSSKLFPWSIELTDVEAEHLRGLCLASKIEQGTTVLIKSHRKFIGPFIVCFKRLTIPLIKLYMKESVDNIAEFQARVVLAIAHQYLLIRNMKISS